MNTKKEVIIGIKKHEEEINHLLNTYDAYLYLVVYDKLDLHGNDWHSITDTITSIDELVTDIKNDDLAFRVRGEYIKDWSSIKSWYLEVWENNPNGGDNLLATFNENLNKIELNKELFVQLMCRVHNCGIDVSKHEDTDYMADALFDIARTLGSVADQFEDENVESVENYGFIGITNTNNNWEYFEQEPKYLREVYKLTEDGYEVFHSWNEEGGFEDCNDTQILEMLTNDDILSKKIGNFVYY